MYSAGAAFVMVYSLADYGKLVGPWIAFVTLVLGPGTVCSFMLFGLRVLKDKNLRGRAFALNCLGLVCIALFTPAAIFIKYGGFNPTFK
jgi:hypothetical protein